MRRSDVKIDKVTQFDRSLARRGKQNQREVGRRIGIDQRYRGFRWHDVKAIGLFFLPIIRRSDRWYRNENGSVASVDPRYHYARLLAPRHAGQEELHNFVTRL